MTTSTRRQFIKTAGGVTVGALALTGISGVLSACAGGQDQGSAPQANGVETSSIPWPYKQLDVERVRKLGHLGYYMGNCSSGSFYGVMRALREEVGYPYTLLPIDPPNSMVQFGGGGVAGWGSHCGGILGASTAINLVGKDFMALVSELTGWYTETAFPSDISNEYASNHEFLHEEFPEKFEGKYKSDEVLVGSVPGSPLCHASVTGWCELSGYKAYSKERSERCARLTGDCAAKAAELLNQVASGQFVPAFASPDAVETCNSCHGKGAAIENTKLKMDCTSCHEPHN